MSASRGSPPLGALFGTVVFVLLVPGTFVGTIPFLLTRWQLAPPFLGTSLTRWLGGAIFVAGLPFFFGFLERFVWEGHGTPAPVAPPSRLVVGGPFRWTRNPGYVGVLSLLVGQALIFASPALLVYAAAVALCFHLFVVLYEEPTLARTFGEDYEAYCRRVPRWIPRLAGRGSAGH